MPAPAHHGADYAELHALSHFSFRRAASAPGELVERAHALGYRALALTDVCSMAGVVRAFEASKATGLPLIIGSELVGDCGTRLVLLAENPTGYGRICRLITAARRRAKKGSYTFRISDLGDFPSSDSHAGSIQGVSAIWKPSLEVLDTAHAVVEPLRAAFGNRLWLGATRRLVPGERRAFEQLDAFGRRHGLARVACGDVRMHRRSRRALLDVLTALDCNRPLPECGRALAANGEAHLRSRETLARLYPAEWLAETLTVAERCAFRLDGLNYRYPKELVPEPLTPTQHLRRLTLDGMRRRWPGGPPDAVRAQVAHELKLIEEMGFEAFFLTVHDVVAFARGRGILCQGRGSAANSAVCYCLGITEVDPAAQQLLFERFISKERNEPPDIDVDFEHERREEVLQYVYEKYGRERAALAATVIHYRPKSALKDVGRALGLDPTRMNRLTASLAWWDQPDCWPERLRSAGFDPDAESVRQLLMLTRELVGMPRHLSQHVGGMVISDAPLHELVPVENAAMADRTIIQWDKDDLETLGLLKVDCLALGMLTALRKGLDLANDWHRRSDPAARALTLANLPREDPATYDMLSAGDAIGVFQVESRAQMAMLPRLKPRRFYDLVIEVAIVRPGPIQGDMVHPYLERRADPSKVRYPGPDLEKVLKRTLGVPIFQEQVMQIAIVAAGFTPGEADRLRRAMAAWKRRGGLEPFRDKLIDGMLERGYPIEFAERIYSQIQGFGDYGFPESHAASFALLTYFSSWMKCHHPAAFCCGLLNSQPMGFYAPAQLVADARRHGIKVLPVDARASAVDCTLCPAPGRRETPAIRLGLRQVRGLAAEAAARLVAARSDAPFRDTADLAERAALDAKAMRTLAESGALKGLAGHRRNARWQALGARRQGDLLAGTTLREQQPQLGLPAVREELIDDYASTGLSLDHHPIGQLRRRLGQQVRSARALADLQDGIPVQAAGVVTHRQRPGTASGVVFLSLEDETGIINVIVWPKLLERFRAEVLQSKLLKVSGKLQNADGSQHVIAARFESLDGWLDGLAADSRDFC